MRFDILLFLLFSMADAQGMFSIPATDPFIIEHPEDQYVAKNEPATLNCKAEGKPQPVITWYRNGVQVATANENPASNRMLLPSGQLFFLRIIHTKNNKPDVGLYYCNATNPVTKISVLSRNATLEIAVLKDEFLEMPEDATIATGTEAKLNCKPPKGEPKTKVRWTKDGHPVKTGDRSFVSETGSLHILDSRKDDSGVYKCVGHNVAGEKESQAAKLIVKDKPYIVQGPRDIQVREKVDVTFECTTTDDADATVVWRKLEGAIPPASRSQILIDKSLRIEETLISDEGTYICRVENQVGWTEAEAKLVVLALPSFILLPADRISSIGRQVTFHCQVHGNPLPAIFWNKDGSQLFMFPNQKYDRINVDENGSLTIRMLLLDDSGEYVCQALNMAGSALAKAKLTVIEKDKRLPPMIHVSPQNQTLPSGGSGSLACSGVEGSSPDTATEANRGVNTWWSKNGKVVSEEAGRVSFGSVGALQISDLRRSDSGTYRCHVSNIYGESIWDAHLSVEPSASPGVVFRRSPSPSTLPGPPSRPVVTEILHDGVRIAWKLPSGNHGTSAVNSFLVQMFSFTEDEGWVTIAHGIKENSLEVKNLKPSLLYSFTVRANNSHGLGPPSLPSNPEMTKGQLLPVFSTEELKNPMLNWDIKVVAISSTQLNVSWPWNSNLLAYIDLLKIKYSEVQLVGEQFWEEIIHDLANPRYLVISNLKKFTFYDVTVIPVAKQNDNNDIANDNYAFLSKFFQESFTKRVQSLEDVPTGYPRDITPTQIANSSTLKISWKPMDSSLSNGKLIAYKIYVFNNKSKLIRELSVNSSSEGVEVLNVLPSSKYSVQISALTKAGEGPRSPIVDAVTLEDKDKNSNFLHESWFVAVLVSIIGSFLWLTLCIFCIIIYRKRKHEKELQDSNLFQDGRSLSNGTKLVPLLGQNLDKDKENSMCVNLFSSCCIKDSPIEYKNSTNGKTQPGQAADNHMYHSLEPEMRQYKLTTAPRGSPNSSRRHLAPNSLYSVDNHAAPPNTHDPYNNQVNDKLLINNMATYNSNYLQNNNYDGYGNQLNKSSDYNVANSFIDNYNGAEAAGLPRYNYNAPATQQKLKQNGNTLINNRETVPTQNGSHLYNGFKNTGKLAPIMKSSRDNTVASNMTPQHLGRSFNDSMLPIGKTGSNNGIYILNKGSNPGMSNGNTTVLSNGVHHFHQMQPVDFVNNTSRNYNSKHELCPSSDEEEYDNGQNSFADPRIYLPPPPTHPPTHEFDPSSFSNYNSLVKQKSAITTNPYNTRKDLSSFSIYDNCGKPKPESSKSYLSHWIPPSDLNDHCKNDEETDFKSSDDDDNNDDDSLYNETTNPLSIAESVNQKFVNDTKKEKSTD